MNKKAQDIQRLLEAMNEKLENAGYGTANPCFHFNEYNDDNIYIQDLGFEIGYLKSLLNACFTRNYIERATTKLDYDYLKLTPSGQKQALCGNSQAGEPGMAIGQITINGPAQIGNGNSQNFSDFISLIEAKINEAPVSESEKEEAKTVIQKISDNQLASQSIASAIGAIIGGVINSLCK
ncbi:MAG: hypothetical protein HDQ89_11335 [Desulfovibrio sp.]|nr:hypothetical protein [Desulfovibrio sp.]